MKIYILISDDVFFKPPLLFRMLQHLGNQVCGVVEVRYPMKNRLSDLRFWGVKAYLTLGLIGLFIRIISHFPLPSFVLSKLRIKNGCRFFGIPFTSALYINTPAFISRLEEKAPDIIVSFQRQVFSDRLLRVPKIACINCHPAELPKYRGPRPVFEAMKNGERRLGVTVHSMRKEIDTGNMICQQVVPIAEENSLMDNYAIAHELYGEVMIKAIDALKERHLDEFPLIPENATYFKAPTKEDITAFREKGLRMI